MSIEKLLTYEGLTEYLRKKDYDEIRDGEFVVHRDTELAETWILVVRQSENYFQGLKAIKDEIKVGDVVEGERKDFGILFSGNKITFVGRVYGGEAELSSASKIKHITKSLDNLSNPAFKKKIKSFIRLLDNPSKIKYWEQLFDRSDIIEEFYQLFLKAREHLSNNVMGITDDTDKMKFVDDLMLQLLIVWYLQAKGFLDDNEQYLIEKFDEYKKHGEYTYFEFLKNLFGAMKGINVHDSFVENDELGKIYVTGPAPFLDTYGKFPNAKIRNEAFYFTDDDSTEVNRKKKKLVMSAPRTLAPKDVPVLALFESRDWIDGDIDRFVIGSLFEKLMTREERKQTGSYYTPEEITMYISENTIKPYIVDKLNSVLNTNYESLDEFFEKETREDAYIQLFKILQGIKIIDPACGSGHFLESAIDTLVSIYRQLREKTKEHNFDSSEFTIVTADEKGLIKKISLLDIDDDNMFELLVMFHIIISRNIYGVDIQENAVKITEARLFLALAEKFNKDIGVFIRFPNVHFNIRSGNSLIGFTDIEGFKRIESKGRQTTLFEALTVVPKKKTTSIPQKIDLAISRDLREYIKNIDKALSLNKSTLELISSVRTNSDKPITVDRIKEVLMLKENLTRILLVSLNTPHVWDIKNIIEHITVAFNQRLDEEFLGYLSEEKGVNITSEELQRIGTFHWVLEFPEVFLDNGGFDVIIGNPPYVASAGRTGISANIDRKLKAVLNKAYNVAKGQYDIYGIFVERGLKILKLNGYLGFILPDAILVRDNNRILRKFIIDESKLKTIIQAGKIFKDADTTNSIILLKKKKETGPYKFTGIYIPLKYPENIKLIGALNQRLTIPKHLPATIRNINIQNIKRMPQFEFLVDASERTFEILLYLFSDRFYALSSIVSASRGEEIGKRSTLLLNRSSQNTLPILAGEDFSRYQLLKIDKFIPKNEIKKNIGYYNKQKLIIRQTSDRIQGVYDPIGVITIKSVYNIHSVSKEIRTKTLLPILNSKIATWFYKETFGKYKLAYPQINQSTLLRMPIPKFIPPVLERIGEYLSMLYQLHQTNDVTELNVSREVTRFFDYELGDSIIYWMYFRDIIEISNKHIQEVLSILDEKIIPINYDHWAELHWNYLLNNLSRTERQELEEITTKNIDTIRKAYLELKNTQEIRKFIELIKSNKYVKIIESNV